jgi:predicted lipoprotein with Yx(FWY)xxD motif
LGGNAQLGDFLVGSNGMTLYTFLKDQSGVSNCLDQCAVNWPPLLLASGQTLLNGDGITGQLGTIQRSDGSLQVTYNGLPLYFFINDLAPGDANGNGFNGVWKVATLLSTPVQSSSSGSSGSGNYNKEPGY